MSFGNLNKMLDRTIKILEFNLGKDSKKDSGNFTKLDLLNLSTIKKQVYHDLQKEFADVKPDIVDEIFTRLFVPKYSFQNSISFDQGKNCFREFEDTYPDIQVPSQYKKLFDHFEKLKNLPQPAQRSKEWYDYRYNRITASDAAAAIDLNPYEPVESFILKKCDPNFPFRDNATVFHGKKYEPTATMIYEHIYNTRVFEFGALPSDKYSFLGASPDGISSKYTLDNKFSERLGTMLEIKCPVTRDIHTSGKVAGDICPFYYYCQVQQQLACCDLDVCDFWQCKISEYQSREEYMADNCASCINTVGNSGAKIQVDDRLKKGIILEFYPKNFVPEFDGDLAEWKSKYIIPKRLDMDESQYDSWTLKMLDQYKTLYPDIAKDYYFYRIIYWKLEASHNVSINRDDKFLASIIPVLQNTWNQILYYREHLDELDKLKEIVDRRKKYIKMNTSYMVHNDEVITKKLLFLDPGFDKKILIKNEKTNYNSKYVPSDKKSDDAKNNPKSKEKDYDSDYIDFIDNDTCDFIDDEPVINVKDKILKSLTEEVKNKGTVKPTYFSKDTKNTYVRKYDMKPEKNTTTTKLKKTIDYSDNDVCNFID